MMNKSFYSLLAVTLALLLMAPAARAETWTIDTTHSYLTFKVRHFFSNTKGSFDEWGGTIQFDPAKPTEGSVTVEVKTATIDTKDEKRDEHLRSKDFFDVENHPTMTFESTGVRKTEDGMILVGNFTLLGVTKEIEIPIEIYGAGPDAWGGTRAGFAGEVKINRKDYGMVWNKALDTGGAILGDDVTVEMEIEAVKATEG
jgi:polyisoprenoid-binding protein YceI